MNEQKLTDGCPAQFTYPYNDDKKQMSGFYFSLRHMLPNVENVEKLAEWGLLFENEETYRRIKAELYTSRSCDDYWHAMQNHGFSWHTKAHMKEYHFIEARNCYIIQMPGQRIGVSKHRRGKRHRMRSVSLPVYPTSGMEPGHA